MANEWTKVELYGQNNDGDCRRFAIADGVAVSKGTLLALVDVGGTRTASAAVIASKVYAGIASEEHLPNQSVTTIAVWTNGIFEATASGAVGMGSPITGAEYNFFQSVKENAATSGCAIASGAGIFGYSFEEAADAEKVNVRLRL